MTSPDLVVAGLVAGQANLDPLAQWRLRPATITVADAVSPMGQFDGEGFNGTQSVDVTLISLVGYVSVGTRVMVMTVPPEGNYIISRVSAPIGPTRTIRIAGVSQTKADATFELMTGASDVVIEDFVKSGDTSSVAVTLFGSAFTSGAVNTSVEVSVTINGTDNPIAFHLYNPVLQHMGFGGVLDIPDVAPGTYDLEIMWRRAAGTGTLNWDASDYVSVRAYETA